MYILGMQSAGGKLFNSIEVERGVNDQNLIESLVALDYQAGSGMVRVVPLTQSQGLDGLRHFFKKRTTLSFDNNRFDLKRDFASNEDDLFAPGASLALASLEGIPNGFGARLRLVSTMPDFDH